MKVIFQDETHKARYHHLKELYSKDGRGEDLDAYTRALAYLLALTPETYNNRERIYNAKERSIKPLALEAGFQTSTTTRITLLAFNLFTNSTAFCDYDEDGADLTAFKKLCTPEHIFNTNLAPYFMYALKLRYPECFVQRYDDIQGQA